jgi:predicted metalloprotease with PDZ domain
MLDERLQSLAPRAPLGGIELSGWKLVYRDTLNSLMKSYEEQDKNIDERFSLGLYLAPDGVAIDAIPGMAAAKAGIAPGMKIMAVNGRRFSKEILRAAIRAAKGTTSPLELLVENVDYFRTYPVEYHTGLRYPFLVRDSSKPDILGGIIKPVTGK